MVLAVDVFLEVELVDRLEFLAVGQPREHAGHRQRHVTRVVGFAERLPLGVIDRPKILARSRGLASSVKPSKLNILGPAPATNGACAAAATPEIILSMPTSSAERPNS